MTEVQPVDITHHFIARVAPQEGPANEAASVGTGHGTIVSVDNTHPSIVYRFADRIAPRNQTVGRKGMASMPTKPTLLLMTNFLLMRARQDGNNFNEKWPQTHSGPL